MRPGRSGESSGLPPVVVLTLDEALVERLVTLAAAAGVALDRPSLPLPGRPPPAWGRAPLLIVGADVVASTSPGHPAGIREVAAEDTLVVVAPSPAEPDLWRHAIGIGAHHVSLLPDGEPWLLDRLLDVASGPARGPVLAVVAGRGGAGASALSVTVALAAVRRRLTAVLVDGDPLGGGLDLLLGAESVPGLRWGDLSEVRGRLEPGLLTRAAVHVDGLHLVSWGSGPVAERTVPARAPAAVPAAVSSGAAMTAVLDACVREADLAVVDVPRTVGPAEAAALRSCSTALLVVPAEVRAAAAAARVAEAVCGHVDDVRLVVRGPAPTGLPAEAVAGLLGLPLAGALDPEPGLPAVLDRGEAAAVRAKGPLGRFAARMVAELVG